MFRVEALLFVFQQIVFRVVFVGLDHVSRILQSERRFAEEGFARLAQSGGRVDHSPAAGLLPDQGVENLFVFARPFDVFGELRRIGVEIRQKLRRSQFADIVSFQRIGIAAVGGEKVEFDHDIFSVERPELHSLLVDCLIITVSECDSRPAMIDLSRFRIRHLKRPEKFIEVHRFPLHPELRSECLIRREAAQIFAVRLLRRVIQIDHRADEERRLVAIPERVNVLLLRIAIVQTLYRFTVPQPLRTVRYADSIMIENADPALIAEVWQELIEAGRIVPNDVYPDHCGLAPALRKRLDNRENIQDDLFLYGPDALR